MYKSREVYVCIVLHTAPSIKSAASEIVFRMLSKEKFRFDLVSTCSPNEIDTELDLYSDVK